MILLSKMSYCWLIVFQIFFLISSFDIFSKNSFSPLAMGAWVGDLKQKIYIASHLNFKMNALPLKHGHLIV